MVAGDRRPVALAVSGRSERGLDDHAYGDQGWGAEGAAAPSRDPSVFAEPLRRLSRELDQLTEAAIHVMVDAAGFWLVQLGGRSAGGGGTLGEIERTLRDLTGPLQMELEHHDAEIELWMCQGRLWMSRSGSSSPVPATEINLVRALQELSEERRFGPLSWLRSPQEAHPCRWPGGGLGG
jgi:hypothetical protein